MKTDSLATRHSKRRYVIVIKNVVFLYSHFLDLALAVQSSGWEVHIIAARNADVSRLQKLGLVFHEVHSGRSPWNVLVDAIRSIQTQRIIRSINPDCIHIIYLKNVLIDGFFSRSHPAPVIAAITGLGSLFAEEKLLYRVARPVVMRMLRLAFRSRNCILAVENADDRALMISCGVITNDRSKVIPGAGIKRTRISPVSTKPKDVVILCAARMIRPKGIRELISAARLLKARNLQFEVWISGGCEIGHPEAISEEELRSAESEGTIKWLGYRTDIPELLSQASIVCLPTYYREGLPRALVEGAAAGLPIVTTDMPGCRDVVISERNGFLVCPRDPIELGVALERLICSQELRCKMGRESRRRFDEMLSLDSVFGAFNGCYEALGIDLKVKVEN